MSLCCLLVTLCNFKLLTLFQMHINNMQWGWRSQLNLFSGLVTMGIRYVFYLNHILVLYSNEMSCKLFSQASAWYVCSSSSGHNETSDMATVEIYLLELWAWILWIGSINPLSHFLQRRGVDQRYLAMYAYAASSKYRVKYWHKQLQWDNLLEKTSIMEDK